MTPESAWLRPLISPAGSIGAHAQEIAVRVEVKELAQAVGRIGPLREDHNAPWWGSCNRRGELQQMVISCYEMTMSTWSVAQAKARFSTLVARAAKSPQRITRRGQPVAVVTGLDASGHARPAAAPHPMRDFLGRCAALRGDGDLGLVLPPRKPQRARPSPFGVRR